MSQLAASVDSSETLWTVDAVPDPEFGFYTVGSEIVQVVAGFPASSPGYAVGQIFPAKIRVIRATNGTTAATHANGSALTAANAFSGGGGGSISVTDGTTTVDNVTNLNVPRVSQTSPGVATAYPAITSDTDPGAIGPGNIWVQLDTNGNGAPQIQIRNQADDGWEDDDNSGYRPGLSSYGGGALRATIAQYVDSNFVRAFASDGSTVTAEVEISDAAAKIGLYGSGDHISFGPGGVVLKAATSFGPGPLVSDGSFVTYSIAAHVAPVDPEVTDADAAVNAVIASLIAAGLMAAS